MTSNSQINTYVPDSTVIEHARNEIDRAPKMKQQIAAKVARNLDELLIELKNCGVAMNAVCREIPLGNPDDRDSRALYKYRNRKGKPPRKYVTKSERYFDIAQAISRIPGHPLTGSSGELLRRVFQGTPYAPAQSSSDSVAIHLKTILDKSVEKIAKHVDLQNTFQQLVRIRHGTQEILQVDDQYRAAINEKKYTLCIPQLELGYFYASLRDDKGNYLGLKSESNGNYWLSARRQVSLFIGLDDDSVPQPFFILETKEGLYANQGSVSILLDRYQDAPRVYGIMFYGVNGQRFLLDEELFMRSVNDPWSDYDSSVSVFSLLDQEYTGHGGGPEPFEYFCEDWSEFELDKEADRHRRHANNKQLTQMFLSLNPDFNSKYIEGKDPIGFHSISVDNLKGVGINLDSAGSLTLGGDSGTLDVPDNFPLLFGDGALGKIMGWFTGSAKLSLELENGLHGLIGEDFERSSYAPPYGWYSANLDRGYWSAADLLWLRTKIFATKIDQLFQATKPQEKMFELFVEWLGDANK